MANVKVFDWQSDKQADGQTETAMITMRFPPSGEAQIIIYA